MIQPWETETPAYALTLWQPMAGAIAHLGKDVENRGWPPPEKLLGQLLAIHAAARKPSPDYLQLVARAAKLQPRGERIAVAGAARGAVVAVARVVGALDRRLPDWQRQLGLAHAPRNVIAIASTTAADRGRLVTLDESPWWLGPVGWLLADVKPLRTPIPARGAQGLWRVSFDLRAALRRDLEVA